MIDDPNQDWWTVNAPPETPLAGADTPTLPTSPTGAPAAPPQDVHAFIQQWQQTHPGQAEIGPLVDALQQAGYSNVSRFMYGATPSNNELSIDGQKFKVLVDGGGWYTPGTNDSPGGMSATDLNAGNFGSIPAPYASNPNAPAPPPVPTWQGGDFVQPAKPGVLQSPYVLPTQAELEATPGYQSRFAQGTRASDMSAAAKGTVLGGGQQKALTRYGQDYASNEYNNLVGQQLAARGENYSEYRGDVGDAFSAYQSRYGQFLDSANLGQQDYTNRYGAYQGDNARTQGDYILNTSTKRNAETDYWTRLNDLYQTGAGLAGGSYRPGV